MKQRNPKLIYAVGMFFLDIAGLVLAFQAAFYTRFYWPAFIHLFPVTKGIPDPQFYQHSLLALLPVWGLVFIYVDFYKDSLAPAHDEWIRVLKGVFLASLLTATITFAYRSAEYSRGVFVVWSAYAAIFLFALHQLGKSLFQRLVFLSIGPQRLLVIGKGKVLEAIEHNVRLQSHVRATLLTSVPDRQALDAHVHRHGINEVVLLQGSVSVDQILDIAGYCEKQGVDCRIVPDLLEIRRGEIIVDRFLGLPTFNVKSLSLHGANYLLKRGFDMAISLIVLTLLFVPLVVISILIRLDSKGPILFTQDRMGLHGNKFKCFKFRTMVSNADDYIHELKAKSDRQGPVFKMKNDPRITRVGKWLRKLSLDEIPQIINVLKGDMSIVGPRPQVLWEAAHYDAFAKKRLRIMPGITGLWQVSGRASLSYEEMINLDVYYLENWSLGLDLKILLQTLPAVLAGEGAY